MVTLCCRMYDVVAEDATIEDTLYYLTRALENGKIDLEAYLKVND
jgi:hypothetical protein